MWNIENDSLEGTTEPISTETENNRASVSGNNTFETDQIFSLDISSEVLESELSFSLSLDVSVFSNVVSNVGQLGQISYYFDVDSNVATSSGLSANFGNNQVDINKEIQNNTASDIEFLEPIFSNMPSVSHKYTTKKRFLSNIILFIVEKECSLVDKRCT